MSELRAPDPTLSQTDQYVVYVNHTGVDVPVAHIQGGCGAQLVNSQSPKFARWFAVPCRECFPDAPPPGHEWASCPGPERCRAAEAFPHLTWQKENR